MNVGALLSAQTVFLNDGVTTATIYPVWDGGQLPLELVASLWVEYNAEIDRGCSFPETHKLMLDSFEKSWFSGVAGVMVRGGPAASFEDLDFLGGTECFGSFYIEPCYPGRSSHLCTAKFLVNSRMRSKGVGLRLASCFMHWAPRLGYDYALFNLVYATNIAFCKILSHLNFRMLTRLKGAGILNGYDFPVDALQYGRPLLVDEEDDSGYDVRHSHPLTSLEHSAIVTPSTSSAPSAPSAPEPSNFPSPPPTASLGLQTESQLKLNSDYANIKMYLESGVYPENTSRSEKTRLRSRSRSYYVENHQLMFKRTKAIVIADPSEQLRIAVKAHNENHNGINFTQKIVSAKYHWAGMRETITRAIHRCPNCRAASLLTSQSTSAAPALRDQGQSIHRPLSQKDVSVVSPSSSPASGPQVDTVGERLDREGLSLDSAAFESAPRDTQDLRPPKDPYASSQFRWENVVYLPPEQDDDEYVPETDPDFDAAAITAGRQPMSDLFQDDDMEFNYNDDEDEDEEYVDDEHDEDDDDAAEDIDEAE